MEERAVSEVRRLIREAGQGADTGARREAIIALGYEKDKSVYAALLEQLMDPSSGIQHAAVISLGRFGDARAIEHLVKPRILRSASVDVRWAAVEAIGRLGDYHVIDDLLKAVEDEAWIVRNQAVAELKSKIRQIIALRDMRTAHILIRLFAMKDREIIELAIEGVTELGDLVVDLLLEGLKSTSSRIRENSARTLGRVAARAAVRPLIERLDDGNWWVRRAAVQALGEIRDTQAIVPLLRCLADNMETVQAQAIRSLVGFGKDSTEPLLNALKHEKNKFVVRAILLTLGEIKDTASIASLIEHLSSSYFVIRLAAARALVQFGPEVIDAVVPHLAVKRMNIQPLLKAAAGGSLLNQLRAIRALGALEDHRAVHVLKKLTASAHPRIAEAADEALSLVGRAAWARCGCMLVLREINDPSALQHYMQALTDTSANVRLEVVRGLGKNASKEAVAPLIGVAKDDRDPYVRAEAVRFLREIGVAQPSVLEYALGALSDPDRDVRSQAAMLLGNFRDDRSIAPLIRAMADRHWIVRESAEISLHNFGERGVPPLLEALSSPVWTLRFRAARLLGEIGDSRAVKPLEALVRKKRERKDVRGQVKIALEKLGKQQENGGR